MELVRANRFAKYLLAGASAALVDFGVFSLCLTLSGLALSASAAEPVLLSATTAANTAGILSGFLWGFFLQKFWTFRSQGHALPQMLATAALLLFNIIISSLAIPWLSGIFGMSLSLAKIVMQAAVVIWNYAIFNHLVFKTAGGRP